MRINKLKLKESGFSLVEVMVSAGLLSALALGVMETQKFAFRGSKLNAIETNWENILDGLQLIYSNENICTQMFSPGTGLTYSLDGSHQLTINSNLTCLGLSRDTGTGACPAASSFLTVGQTTQGIRPVGIVLRPMMTSSSTAAPERPINVPIRTGSGASSDGYAFPVYLTIEAGRVPPGGATSTNLSAGGTLAAGNPASTKTVDLMLYFNAAHNFVSCNAKKPSSSIPSGAILPFNGATCPTGWNSFDPTPPGLAGRILMGGRTTAAPQWGGVSQVQLGMNQIPNHTHDFGVQFYSERCAFSKSSGSNNYTTGNRGQTWYDGWTDYSEGQSYQDTFRYSNGWVDPYNRPNAPNGKYNLPHNHMPPYYTVKWCRKD